MQPATENKIVLIVRRTRLDELIARFNTLEQARFYIEHQGADFSDYQQEHAEYRACVAQAETVLRALGRVQVLDRRFLPNYLFGPRDTVVALGQDGLVANTLKYLDGQRLIGINPSPARWDGILLPFLINDLARITGEVFANKRAWREIRMAEARLNNGQQLYAVNDFFIGPKSHVSARYTLSLGRREETQSSSGVIVSTGLGSTGWLKSLLTGACNIARQRAPDLPVDGFPWDAEYLYFTVREPFPSRTSRAELVFGKITRHAPLRLASHMPENGVIFSDGMESDFLEFNAGTQAEIRVAEKRGYLIV